jgi:Glycosyl hydrolases family 16
MSGPLRARASLASAAAMGLLLILNVSSAASGAGLQGAMSPQVAVPALDSPTTTVTPGTSVAASSSSAPASASGSLSTSATAASTLARVTAASGTSTLASAKTTKASAGKSVTAAGNPASATTPQAYSGWNVDWSDNFTTPLDQTKWARYGYGGQAPGQGGMGVYQQSNAFTSGGLLNLRTQYANGAWSSAGMSSGDFYSASGGRWEIRAKFPVAKGIGYVFLLYPADGSWPPEIDMAEGRVNGPSVMSTYHWGSSNSRDSQFLSNSNMSGWHTYGVIIGSSTITYTFDGKPWATINNAQVTTKKLWIGFQCAAMDPNGSAKQYETVDNGVPGPLTPAVSDIQIDWVAHYAAA